jgi:uncharacterized membrane protein
MAEPSFLDSLSRRFSGPNWEHWPFGPGTGDLLASLSRLLLVAAILLFIVFYLRLLFGPKGWFRDHEMDREAAQERETALAELDRRLAAGEIDEAQHRLECKRLGRDPRGGDQAP